MNEHLADAGFGVDEESHLKGLKYQFECAFIILLDNQKIGLLKKEEKKGFIEIIQVQVAPEFQGKGVGKKVIQSIIADAFGKNLAVQLSVLKNNRAKQLYAKLGFKTIDEDSHSYIMRVDDSA